jgi:HSP20 family protein
MWRRKRREWDDIFDEIAEKMFRDLDEFIRAASSGEMFRDLDEFIRAASSGEMRPFVRGFSIRIGPDGKPEIKEFGTKPGAIKREIEERKPLIDVMETDENIHIIAEMPGINKEDIDLNASERSVEIKAEGENRKYYETIELPCEAIPESAKARYNNGVLEIVFKKAQAKKEDRKKIQIE